ncbi:putative receptor-like protein kinase At3g47110 isoform X2 [Hevea brasiliensis]|uniref:putative receptor-like protein kinase At3g47110 isoform X2 n=1 Tax=Hevea brasiliensis TaxID=3981 RepID=UPI0025E132CB|nr:putative receptor-like protein kinase At3g47110 isoform X2 [Hevea brasiliensis]
MKIFEIFLVYLQLVIFLSSNLQFMHVHSLANETDQLALLKFKARISSDPYQIFNSWNHSLPFCQWYGITCSRRHQRVTSMVLKGQNLTGSISPYIGNLSFLRVLNLRNNIFNGQIPQEVGNLFRLQAFNLQNNAIQELGSLEMLEVLLMCINNVNGKFPASLGNLSSLAILSAAWMELEGNIPHEFGQLTGLEFFAVMGNKLSGIFPSSFFNISSLNEFSIAENKFRGSLPNNIGITLPNLQRIGIGDNLFSGSIPNSFCNASQLELLDLSINNFEGQVPNCLGNLQSLFRLTVSDNNLGYNSTNDLDFLTSLKNCSNLQELGFDINKFGGVLPNSIANLSVQLEKLYFGNNQIRGTIPEALENLINLILLAMEGNLFTGVIPSWVGKLRKLQNLFLYGNRLSGQIPSFIGNLTQLSLLSISRNNLEGNIPESIRNCQSLQKLDISGNNLNGSIPKEVFHLRSLSLYLDLSYNSLTGVLPVDVGKLTNINELDVSGNMLSGEIPGTIGSCSSLEYLFMQENSFQGIIPSSLSSLKGLQGLDLSRNNLTGEIPKDLQSLHYLSYLNLSFNDLMGEIPINGVFRNASAISLIGNNKLCGGVPKLHQPKCPTKAMKKGKSIAIKLAIIIPCVIFCVLLMLASMLAYRRKVSKKSSSDALKELDRLVKVSYKDLYDATSGFSADNLIGSGNFGSVYKGFLNQMERPVAIKVLKLGTKGASKSFVAECKVLRTVRHRNLVKLFTYCSSIDYKQNDFKALVYEFMGNGSLEKWLHHDIHNNNQSRHLNFFQRLTIAIDVASALHYVHDLCEIPIIHCDLKPSNVLLDDEMVAHLSDFGLAKLFLNTNDASQTQTSSIGIRGTIGYAPPEYAMGGTVSKEGDVYSYGILVLEMFSGKRPTDKIFGDLLNLHNFVKDALPKRLSQITCPTLLSRGMEETPTRNAETEEQIEIYAETEPRNNGNLSQTSISKEKDCLLSVFKVGVACSAESPKDRMSMRDVVKELHLIRSIFLGVRIYE